MAPGIKVSLSFVGEENDQYAIITVTEQSYEKDSSSNYHFNEKSLQIWLRHPEHIPTALHYPYNGDFSKIADNLLDMFGIINPDKLLTRIDHLVKRAQNIKD